DLGKLDKTGSKIHGAIVQVEDYWAKLIKVNSNAPKALKMYADFLIEILNDAEAGGELLSRAKETAIARPNYNPNSLDATELMGMGDMCASMGGADGTPCMVASGEQGKLGEILQFNMAVCRLFGYTKAELAGRKITSLMPEMYARVHDKILQRCINSNEDVNTAGAKDVFVLARHKSGYLMPIFLQARMMSSVTHGTLFVATFKSEKKGLNVCYLLLNEQQDVVGVSSRCISTLKLSSRLLKNSRVSFQTLAPSIQDKSMMSLYNASKSGGMLDFYLPDATLEEDSEQQSASHLQKSELITESMQHLESPAKKLRVKASKEVLHLTCVISEIILMGETTGYVVRLESADESKDFAFASKVEKLPKYPNIQFAFDPIEMKYIQQDCLDDAQKRIAEETSAYVSIMRDRSHSSATPVKSDEGQRQDTSMMSSVLGPGDEIARMKQGLLKRKDFGKGVTTRRLVNGEEISIDNANCRLMEKQLEEDQEQEEAKRREGKSEDKKDDIFQSSLKSKKAFNAALNEKSVPSSINKLKKTGYVIVLVVLALASTEFGLILTEFNDIGDNIDMVKYSRLRIAIQMKMVFYINQVVLTVRTSNPRIYSKNSSSIIAAAKKNISTALNEYYDVQNKITLSTLSLSSENERLYTDKCVSLNYKNSTQQQSTIKLYTLTEAIQQLASEVFTIQSFTSSSNYAVGNDDVDFVLYNAFADLYDKMVQSADLFVRDLKDRGNDKQIIVYCLYAAALFICVLSVAFLFPVVASVSRTRLDVLSLFFDIPQNSVKVLEKKCEKFVARSNDENVDDIMSNEGEMLVGANGMVIDATETPESSRTGRHKRKFKNNTTSNTTFYLQFLFAILVIAGYFSFNFAYGYLFLKSIAKYSRELNATTGIHAETSTSFALYQNLIGNRRILMYSEDATFNLLALQEISSMYAIASEVQNSHNDNLQSFGEDYQDIFIDIMRKSLCDYKTQFNFTFGECSTFLDGTLVEGLHPVIIHYIEQLREQLTAYKSTISSTTNQKTINATMTSSFLNGTTIASLETTIFQIIDVAMRYLVDSLISSYS
ncbi:MAG TPA: PAS domain S-box protein, partial [Oculatellaceae cyanobacterium]